jgi:hypothetical protein
MPPSYFELTADQQTELLQGATYRTPWSIKMLEKDLWVVWTLDSLFQQPDAPKYAFKGGTSLSKVYRAIHRFSEDIDITLDPNHPSFLEGVNPVEEEVTKTQLKKRGDQARAKLPEFLATTLAPYSARKAQTLPRHTRLTVEIENAEQGRVRVHYPSVLEPSAKPPYIAESVLLELGARAGTEPSTVKRVGTYLGDLPQLAGQVAFPTATVRAMTLERTFWEKATLIHFENTRNDEAPLAERYARHWYDLHALTSDPALLQSALANPESLQLVLRIKHAHYGGKGVRYDDCGVGRLRLAASGALRNQLALDYDKMITANMFVETPPPFDAIADRLAALETQLNAHFASHPVSI